MTDTTIAKIQEQLRVLLQLTQTEAQLAQFERHGIPIVHKPRLARRLACPG